MSLEDKVRELRQEAIAAGRPPVPEQFQGVSKERIALVLSVLDRGTRDQVDTVFALLDDQHDSWIAGASPGAKFCDGATVGHIACHVGILQRGEGKLDREGRDYWIKPMRDIVAIEAIYFDRKRRDFLPGHPVAKSPLSSHRLSPEFKRILQAPESSWRAELSSWIGEDRLRQRLEFQAMQAAETRSKVDTSHANLIRACVEQYAPHFLSGFEVLYVDDSDGDRVDEGERTLLEEAGLDLLLGDAMPDVLLHNRELNELWVIEAVTSDGEVDDHKVQRMVAFANRHGKDGVGFTTAYATWKAAAKRQAAHKNIPPATYVWIREDASKHYRADEFGSTGSKPSTIRSKPS